MSVRRSPAVRFVFLFLSILFSLALSACSSDLPQTTLEPKSFNAAEIQHLFEPIFWAAAAVFIVVEALLVYSAFRFRAGANAKAIPEQIHGNTPLEIGWTIAPAVILGIIFLLTAQTLNAVSYPQASAANTINVKVFGHQWWWEFQYPDIKTAEGKPLVTATDLHIPANALVNYTLESVDVIHSFWVPALNGKTDVIPGHVNHGFFNAAQVVDTVGQCAEFCGAEHAQMRFRVYVQSDADFQAWVKGQQALPATPTGLAKTGADLFAKSSCIGCHTIGGTAAAGLVGPNLTHFGSRATIAAGTLTNTPENLSKWLHNPEAVKPGNDMSVAMVSQVQTWGGDADSNIAALVAYLESLK